MEEKLNVRDIKTRRRIRWGFVLTFAIFVCVVIVVWQFAGTIEGHDTATFGELLDGMNGLFLLAAVSVLIVVMLCDVAKYLLLNKAFSCPLGILRTARLALTGKYYEAITPTATGGQPMQILYMHSKGVSGGKSTAVVLAKYVAQMLASCTVGAIFMAIGASRLSVINGEVTRRLIFTAGWVGFAINACAPVFVTIIIFCPRFLKWLIGGVLSILHKVRIVKKLEERKEKIFCAIDDFSVCSQFIFKHPIKFLELFVLCLTEPLSQCILPYLIILSLCPAAVSGAEGAFLTVAALATFSNYGASFIPTPGMSGAAEALFMLAFASISGDVLFWVVIVWRFLAYYSYILMGVGMNIFDLSRGIAARRRRKKLAAKGEL